MRTQDVVLTVLNLMYDEGVEYEYASPNFVADFAYNRGFELSSQDVVYISDTYGEETCPTGRAGEVLNENV